VTYFFEPQGYDKLWPVLRRCTGQKQTETKKRWGLINLT